MQSTTLNNLELTRIFFAIVSLLATAHFFGYLFHRISLPRVVGEIFGGCLLGPTVLGQFSSSSYNWLFDAFSGEGKLLSLICWLGLVMLMFISGFEVKNSIDRSDKRLIFLLVVSTTTIPFLAGWCAPSFYDFSPFLGVQGKPIALKIVIAIAVAVTSIPVISRIFLDLNLMNTRFARVVLATATVHDVILWVALAVATGLVGSQPIGFLSIIWTVAATILFFFTAVLVVPKLLEFTNRLRANLLIKSSIFGYTLLICLLFSAIASLLDVNIVFGAFLAGVVVGMMPEERFDVVKNNIKEISFAFFIPIYFAVVGLKLDLIHYLNLKFFLGFFLFATAFSVVGTIVAAKSARLDWFSSFNLCVAMNTKGGPCIVLATVAFDLGIINQEFYVTLVLMSILTSLIAGYWFRIVTNNGWSLLR